MPLLKKGNKAEISNYRPASLSSPVGKVIERVVFKNLNDHLHSNDLLYKCQTGYVTGHSTTFYLIDINNYYHIWRRTGTVVSIADYGQKGPWFETWPGRSSLWP